MQKIVFSNAVISNGFEGKDAIEVTTTANGTKVARFRVGVPQYSKDGTVWENYNAVAFGDVADRLVKMKAKPGSHISISGVPHNRAYENKDKEKRVSFEITVEEVEYLPILGGNKGEGATTTGGAVVADVADDDDLPFGL